MARGGDVPERRGELDPARGWEGSGEGDREHVLREQQGKESGEGAGQPDRHVVAVAHREAVLGMRAERRRRVARSRGFGEEPGAHEVDMAGAQCVADQWLAPAANGITTA